MVSLAALLISAGALWYSRGQKLAADRSARAAEESATAAAETADIDKARRAEELDNAERNRVVWRLEHTGDMWYRLINCGTESAYGVQIDAGELIVEEAGPFGEIASDGAEPLLLARSWASNADRIVVTWHHQPDLSDEPRYRELLV
ncbi:hypothetical protein H0B56_12285 [Haloechinothrix sp. YIM 98757]|uniref:Uncharacterized protein n=1 Tax=Haloechinothrix aidingensis TaxID=2752311 RepID=A0A838AAQ4_9PSEU|nr:hypothetical protein [Haloechinothrix aidingensis]